MQGKTLSVLSLAVILLGGCGGGGSGGSSTTPAGSPTAASVGRAIFFDTSLSSNSNQSCASCHDPDSGFADPNVTQATPVSEGSVGGAFGNRNAPTAAYAGYAPAFGTSTTAQTSLDGSKYQGGQFLDGRRDTLAAQAKDPFLNPVEMNNADATEVVNKLRNAPYVNAFLSVYGSTALDDVTTAYNHIADALAAFENSAELNRFSSKFDASLVGRYTMTASEANGLNLFRNKAKCANCHVIDNPTGGPALFTNFKYFNIGTPINTNNPAYISDNTYRDAGLADNPGINPADVASERGKFKVPTLRNVELTAPYMHNGVFATLEEVITHYDIMVANGFTTPEVNANIASELTTPLNLTAQETTDLVNFLKTLTDGYM